MLSESSVAPLLIDPVRSRAALPLRTTLYPLGFPLRLESNSPAVIQAAMESWTAFPHRFDETPIQLCLGVDGEGDGLPLPPTFLSREHLMSIVSDARNSVMCDMQQGFAFGWVTKSVAEARAFFRYHFLDAAVLTMLDQLYLTPVHGGLIERDGHGILLCGESFAGKKYLGLCLRPGWMDPD